MGKNDFDITFTEQTKFQKLLEKFKNNTLPEIDLPEFMRLMDKYPHLEKRMHEEMLSVIEDEYGTEEKNKFSDIINKVDKPDS